MLFSTDRKENDLIVVRNQALEYATILARRATYPDMPPTTESILSDAEKYLKFLRTA